MEENIVIDKTFEEENSTLVATIEAKVKELKSANPSKRVIYPIVVDGNVEAGEKEHYIGYFCQPSFKDFSKFLVAQRNNEMVAMRNLAKDCFLDGDKELYEDDSLFMFGLLNQLTPIISVRTGRLVNLSKPGK